MDPQVVVLLTELVEYFKMFLVVFGLMCMFIVFAVITSGR